MSSLYTGPRTEPKVETSGEKSLSNSSKFFLLLTLARLLRLQHKIRFSRLKLNKALGCWEEV